MTTANNMEDSLHNNNDHRNLKSEITYIHRKEVLMNPVFWKNDINDDHCG